MSPSLEYARSQSCHSKLLSLYCDFRWARYAFTQPNFSGSGTAGSWSCDLNCSQMSHTVNLRRQTWACLNIQTQSKIAKLVPEKELNNRGTWFSVGTQGNPSSPADRPGEKCWTLHQSGQANSGPIFRLTLKFKTNSNHSIAESRSVASNSNNAETHIQIQNHSIAESRSEAAFSPSIDCTTW